MSEREGYDICYCCRCTQEYNTMRDIDENSFAIFCDDCYDEAQKWIGIFLEAELIDGSTIIAEAQRKS